MEKQNDLQPWLEYFEMLRLFIQQGHLEMIPATHEAFITLPALHTLANTDDLLHRWMDGENSKEIGAEIWERIRPAILNIRTYSQFLNTNADAYKEYAATVEVAEDTPATVDTIDDIDNDGRVSRIVAGNRRRSFILHVVAATPPHDLEYTVIVTRRRRWYWPWRLTEKFTAISYK